VSLRLQPVDRAEIVILADNYCEQVILSTDRVFRPGGLTVKPWEREVALKAEHGFSAVVRLFQGDEVRNVMIDTGRSGTVAVENASYAAIVNTVRYGLELAGIDKLLAVIGGFHLCWPISEAVVRRTLDDLKEFKPDYLVPCHCTGWDASRKIATEIP